MVGAAASSVFRSMLIRSGDQAPDDLACAAKLVWDNYYANHQKKGVQAPEGGRHLHGRRHNAGGRPAPGMQMVGNDLNPVVVRGQAGTGQRRSGAG